MADNSPFGSDEATTGMAEAKFWDFLDIREKIGDAAPWYAEVADISVLQGSLIAREFIAGSWNYEAAAIIFNQSLNDWFSLLEELANGSGRPATRTARALVEHAINIAGVSCDHDVAERYVTHLALAAEYQANAKVGLERLSGNDQKGYAHRLKKFNRDATPVITAAMSQDGSNWRRKWAGNDRYSRARSLGLESFYDFYRIASLVMHGAAGGSLGTLRTISGLTAHRTGPALDLCPIASASSMTSFAE